MLTYILKCVRTFGKKGVELSEKSWLSFANMYTNYFTQAHKIKTRVLHSKGN